jgi:ubiquinone/menaquinone biosynthesis C-methylase UbiE
LSRPLKRYITHTLHPHQGLFTRRFAKEDTYNRVLGCDYSDSMLTEARRRISEESLISKLSKTRLDLVRLDVGRIPMQNGSVDALHAGAAMHCWPDLQAAVSEVYRVLKPGGRYFATTFLSNYFGALQQAEGGATGPSRQAFQYFESVDQLRKLLEVGGFQHDKIKIEILGAACVVIRCEK